MSTPTPTPTPDTPPTEWLPDGTVESIAAGWKERLLKSEKGKRLPVVANALIALRCAPEWQNVLPFDESSFNIVAKLSPPWENTRARPFVWNDEDDIRTAAWLQHQGILGAKETAAQAVQTIAHEKPFHPIRDYLNALEWDGTARLDNWLADYTGAEDSDYVRAVSAKFLLGAVARIFQPGCKNDCCPILEGPQGLKKSTALRTLFQPYFTDDMPELGTKDASLQTRGVWCIELSELDAMAKSEVSKVKAFMSRAADHFRPPYGRRPIDAPRECVFAGTVNHAVYLKDETGGRRFWPVKCFAINIDALKPDKDQLWAEAVVRYRAGESWWLDSIALNAAAETEQENRLDADPWQAIIEPWSAGRENVTIAQILENCISKPAKDWCQLDKNRIARCLTVMKWERFHKRVDSQTFEWRYRKALVTSVTSVDD